MPPYFQNNMKELKVSRVVIIIPNLLFTIKHSNAYIEKY